MERCPIMDKIYLGDLLVNVFTTYLKRNRKQRCIIKFGTWSNESDSDGRPNQNFEVFVTPIKFEGSDENLSILKKDIKLIGPYISFIKMFRNKGIDIRDHINDCTKVEMEFIKKTRKNYVLTDFKVVGSTIKVE